MTTTETPTIDQVLTLARRLSPRDQAHVVAALASQVAQALPAALPALARRALTPDEARALWVELRESMRALPGPRRTLGEQLDADRRDRDRALTGRYEENSDVDA